MGIQSIQFFLSWKKIIYITWLFVFGLVGSCDRLYPVRTDIYTSDLERALQYYRQGDYQRSLQGCLGIIESYPKKPYHDQALYYAALNYLFIGSTDEDYSMALQYFKKVIEECPGSPLLPESAQWVELLTDLAFQKSEIADAQKILKKKQPQLQACRFQLKKIKSQLRQKDLEIQSLKLEIDKLKKKIDLLEKVDLQIHQKKRDLQNAESPVRD
jgi:tetratricopeptide (TPR) repeat protein